MWNFSCVHSTFFLKNLSTTIYFDFTNSTLNFYNTLLIITTLQVEENESSGEPISHELTNPPEVIHEEVVETTEIKDLGATVRLLEYGAIEGFIQMSQVSTRRVRSVQKYLKIGRREMMEVLRVDEGKMYIDLSKKSLMPDSLDEA